MKKYFILLAFFMLSCGIPVTYDIGLIEVEKPTLAGEKYGEKKITREDEGSKYTFEDGMLRITLFATRGGVAFTLNNKTEQTMKFLWDDAVLLDEEGNSMRVIHSGVAYVDRYKTQVYSVIARKSVLTDLIIPSDSIHYRNGWHTNALFPYVVESSEEMKEMVGARIGVLMPLKIGDVLNEYIFTFEVENVNIITYEAERERGRR